MIATQFSLIRREIWEHRSLYVVPAVLALIVTLMSITGQVAVSSFGQGVDVAILGASNLGEAERAVAISMLLVTVSGVFITTMGIVITFYALDALYAERKDKSILFWRSLPVTDAETIVSKLLTAALVVPAITFVSILVTHVIVLLSATIWIDSRGASAWQLVWGAAPFLDNWSATFIATLLLSLWAAPVIGWFLFVSAFAKRSPFLFAFLPLIIMPMLERILFGSSIFAETLLQRLPFNAPLFRETVDFSVNSEEELAVLVESGAGLMSLLDVGRFLGSPAVWIGLAVCGVFCTAAIYVRRYRDES